MRYNVPQRDLMMDENGDMIATEKSDKQIAYEKGFTKGFWRGIYIMLFIMTVTIIIVKITK